jgi:hypothetical protein
VELQGKLDHEKTEPTSSEQDDGRRGRFLVVDGVPACGRSGQASRRWALGSWRSREQQRRGGQQVRAGALTGGQQPVRAGALAGGQQPVRARALAGGQQPGHSREAERDRQETRRPARPIDLGSGRVGDRAGDPEGIDRRPARAGRRRGAGAAGASPEARKRQRRRPGAAVLETEAGDGGGCERSKTYCSDIMLGIDKLYSLRGQRPQHIVTCTGENMQETP